MIPGPWGINAHGAIGTRNSDLVHVNTLQNTNGTNGIG